MHANPYALSLCLPAAVSLGLMLWVWRRRETRGAMIFLLLMGAVAIWSLAYGLELMAADLALMLFWVRMEYLGIPFVPALWLILVLQHTDKERWLTRRNVLGLFAIPCLTLVLNWTNNWHYWYYAAVDVARGGPIPLLSLKAGPWYYVSSLYSYVLLIAGFVLLIQRLCASGVAHRAQTWTLLTGASFPVLTNFIYLLGVRPFGHLDLTPFAFAITGIAAAWGIFRHRLFDLAPIARDRVIEGLTDAMLVLDPQGRLVDYNPSAARLFGWAKKPPLGQPADSFLSDWLPPPMALETTDSRSIEIQHEHRDERRFYEISVSRLKGRVGQVVGTIIMLHDITDRKKAEEALRQAKALAEERSQAAEAANIAKSQFLANMSHELRTPLNSIIGLTALLLDTPLSAEQRDWVATVQASGDALLRLISDILDFSKIESGKMDLEKRPFNLRDCVEAALDQVTLRATEKGLELAYWVGEGLPTSVIGDSNRLSQVLMNLLGNAVKFTERGEVILSVEQLGVEHEWTDKLTDELRRAPIVLHISVRDTGIGIPPQHRERLFQSFSQLDASSTRRYGGAGLGLAICRRMVELMGGVVWVESEGIAGRGSCFHILLPTEAVAEAPAFVESFDLSGRRALVIEAHQTTGAILCRQLTNWGLACQALTTLDQVREAAAQAEPVHFVMLDAGLLESAEGTLLSWELRRREATKGAPILLLVPFGARPRLPAGVDPVGVVTKPVKPAALRAALRDVLAPCAAQLPRAEPCPPAISSEPLAPLHILLAEDDPFSQKVILLMLQRIGCTADCAPSGAEVLRALRQKRYDVVLVDVMMPDMDGVEATRRIRSEWPADQQPRIIALTAHAIVGDRERFMAAGMDDYLSKPIRLQELRAALRRQKSEATNGLS